MRELCLDQKLEGQNSIEALSLISQLPRLTRAKYASLLDLDPRLVKLGINISLNAYYRSIRKVVNPQGADISVIYGCSGGDAMSVLLATDAEKLMFVDITKVDFSEFENALTYLKDSSYEKLIIDVLERDDYFSDQTIRMGQTSRGKDDGKHYMNNLALKLLFNLRQLGVDLDGVVLTSLEEGIRIDFSWQYYGSHSTRQRSITFITADIANSDQYPKLLKRKLEEGLDIFYMKGAFFVPQLYSQFLPDIAKSIRPGGWIMTTDKTSMMESFNPEECLKQNKMEFKLSKSDETRILEEQNNPPYDPLCDIPVIQFNPTSRLGRTTGTDLSYWSFLNLRQKAFK